MDKQIFEEIARELKMLNNKAVELIKSKKFNEAKNMYEIASNLSDLVGYKQGVGMSAYSVANLEIVRGDYIVALHYAELAYENYTDFLDKERVSNMKKKLALQLVKDGIKQEKQGSIDDALKLFNYALPYLNEKRRDIVLCEIDLLRKVKASG